MTSWILFLTFCKYGMLCFGGGYMFIPLLMAEFVGDDKLLSAEKFANLISISQLTPGPVGINTATFAGYVANHFPGALAATLGLVFPTLIFAGIAMKFIIRYKEHPLMKGVLAGARIGATALIFYAVVVFMGLSLLKGRWESFAAFPGLSPAGIIIMLTAFVLLKKCKWQTVWVILLSGAAGAVLVPLIG